MEKRICIKDLAPFASAEDLSDERESPPEIDTQKSTKLDEIAEEMTTPVNTNLSVRNTTPRIDISRASSSSQQEDSSPEREMLFEKSHDIKFEVAFGEEIASELHSSTEELSFYDNTVPDGDKGLKKKKSFQAPSFPDTGAQNESHFRKDSGCSSDIGLLCISSGRTSRVSSVGSVASGGSGISNLSVTTSRCSGNSHLSAGSNLSRGSSPHRTSVETSFCGPKPVLTQGISLEDDTTTAAVLDKIRRKLETVSAGNLSNGEKNGGANVDDEPSKLINSSKKTTTSSRRGHESRRHPKTSSSSSNSKSRRKKPPIENPKTQKFVSLYSDEEDDESIASRCIASTINVISAKSSQATVTTTLESTQILIPLKGDDDCSESRDRHPAFKSSSSTPKRMKPFTNTMLVNFISKYGDVDLEGEKREAIETNVEDEPYVEKNGINTEFQTFISLKDDDDGKPTSSKVESKARILETNGTGGCSSTSTTTKTAIVSAQYAPNHKTNANGCTTSNLAARHSFSYYTTTATTGPVVASNNSGGTPLRHCRSTTKYDQNEPHDDRADSSNDRQNGTKCLSVNKYEPMSRSDDRDLSSAIRAVDSCAANKTKMNLQLNFSERPTRSARSMTQLLGSNRNNEVEYCSSRSTAPSPNDCDGANNSKYLKVDNYPFRRSESEKEMAENDRSKSRSRSGSIKSLFSSFFKKNTKTNDKKTAARVNDGHENCRVERNNEWTTGTNKMVTQSSTKIAHKEADFIIIPLYSPDNAPSRNSPPPRQPDSIDDSRSDELPTTILAVKNSPTTKKTPNVCQTIHLCEVHEEIRKRVEINSPKDNEPVKKDKIGEIKLDMIEQNEDYSCIVKDDREYKLGGQQAISRTTDGNVDERIKQQLQKEDETDKSSDSDKVTPISGENEEENKKLVNQEESFEELPYIPTTLPLERSVAVPMIPVRERTTEIRTQSIDRPRSSTPSHRGSFDFCVLTITAARKNSNSDIPTSSDEKLHITLPR